MTRRARSIERYPFLRRTPTGGGGGRRRRRWQEAAGNRLRKREKLSSLSLKQKKKEKSKEKSENKKIRAIYRPSETTAFCTLEGSARLPDPDPRSARAIRLTLWPDPIDLWRVSIWGVPFAYLDQSHLIIIFWPSRIDSFDYFFVFSNTNSYRDRSWIFCKFFYYYCYLIFINVLYICIF